MSIDDWSIGLVSAVVGAAFGLLIDWLFHPRTKDALCLLLGVLSLLLVFLHRQLAFAYVNELCGMFLGCFAETVVSRARRKIHEAAQHSDRLLLGITLICGFFWLGFLVKVFRYHYELGPAYSWTEPLVFLGISGLYWLGMHRCLVGPSRSHAIVGVLWFVAISAIKQGLALLILVQVGGYFFVSRFNFSARLVFLALFSVVVLSIVEHFTRPQWMVKLAKQAAAESNANRSS